MPSKKERILTREEAIERSLDTEFRYTIWRRFIAALGNYKLILPGDKICVCISGGKDSMLMGLLFKHLKKYSSVPFDVEFLVMNPGYSELNLQIIKNNLQTLQIPARIVETDIFDIANSTSESPCYLCARMRRGALYRIAKSLGCNKIALGHHYDDVIETTLMNMLNSGSFQTMLPKLHSDHYEGMEIIRPLYLIREESVLEWKKFNKLTFIQCACRFTENCSICDNGSGGSQRQKTKALIKQLMVTYSPMVEKNIFKAGGNVVLDKVLGYKEEGVYHDYLETYEEDGARINQKISSLNLEKAAVDKAENEHRALKEDDTFYNRFKQ
ncbi:MAG: ATP-binding protein [Mollicutes bacterium]|nr:ATP-binding protein [Mollicutes bacterium]MDY6071069.1 ATP-binding protein [Bacilli bacterium]